MKKVWWGTGIGGGVLLFICGLLLGSFLSQQTVIGVKQELAVSQQELSTAKQDLTVSQQELTKTKQDLTVSQQNNEDLQKDFNILKDKYQGVQQELVNLSKTIGDAKEQAYDNGWDDALKAADDYYRQCCSYNYQKPPLRPFGKVVPRTSSYYRPPCPAPHPSEVCLDRFVAQVYAGENFKQYVGSFSESSINHDWGSGGPLGLTDHFNVNWKGEVWFESGDHQFKVRADDEVRLYVDGELLIDKWGRQSARTYEAELYLTRGYHEVRVEYFDFQDESVIRLSWELNP